MPSAEVQNGVGGAKCSMSPGDAEKPPMLKYTPSPEESIAKISSNIAFNIASAQSPQARASPAPMPNGKPASPYVKESSPMLPGAGQTISSKDPKAAAAAANEMRNVVRRKLTGYVGFANLPNQWHRKSVRKGFSFNVMVVGMSASNLMAKSNTKSARRVWSRKVYVDQYPL